MNIFIIGETATGKSTLAKYLANKFGYKHIQSSHTLKQNYPQKSKESYYEYISRITQVAQDLLCDDPDHFVKYIRSEMNDNKNIIEGLRNIRDFMLLFNPKQDIIIKTGTDSVIDHFNEANPESLHKGVRIIYNSIEYMVDNFKIKPPLYFNVIFDDVSKNVNHFIKESKIYEYIN